jgi:hypothetical protein
MVWEFISYAIKSLLDQNGIIHERTVVYTPQQNGISKRGNIIVVNMIRYMLVDSKCMKETSNPQSVILSQCVPIISQQLAMYG